MRQKDRQSLTSELALGLLPLNGVILRSIMEKVKELTGIGVWKSSWECWYA